MPWRECCKMDERLRFVARLLEGEKMAVLCHEFDISPGRMMMNALVAAISPAELPR